MYTGMGKNIFAVDIGGSKLICGILTPEGKILECCREDYTQGYTLGHILKGIRAGYEKLKHDSCGCCGIAVPGLCDADSGTWLYSPFSGISDVAIGQILQEITGLPAYADNDVNVCALAEHRFGICKDKEDFLWITVSNGIGGGLFLNGRLYRGARMTAGEIGHCIVEEQSGNLCGCGSRGCLEAMASGASIASIYCRRTGRALSAKEIADRAREGENEARRVWWEAGFYIGKAAAHGVNLLGLDTIVLGGGAAESFDLLEGAAREALRQFSFAQGNPEIQLLHSSLGSYGALYGCAAIALERNPGLEGGVT